MKKNSAALMLVFFAVLSCPVFSNQEGCEHTAEFTLGSIDARNQTVPLKCGVLSFGVIWLGFSVGLAAYGENHVFSDWNKDRFVAAIIGVVIGMGVSIAVPLAIKPKPKVIPEHISEENLKCYLDGYALRARRRRVDGALAGCAVGGLIFIFPAVLVLGVLP